MVKMKCCRVPKDIKLSDLWVSTHNRASDFYVSSWQGGDSPMPLLLIRLLAFLVALSIMCWAVYEGCNLYWLMFLTNWGLMLVTAMFFSGVIVSMAAVCTTIPEAGELPWYVSMYWLLHNIAIGMSLLISLLYWVLLYNPEVKDIVGTRLFVLDLMTHGVNSILVVVELIFSRTPVRFLHIWQPLGVGLWYGFFTLIYFLCGGTDGMGNPFIYEILDWRRLTASSIIVVISAVALILIYCAVVGFAFCRDKVSTALFRTVTVKFADVPSVVTSKAGLGNPLSNVEDFV